MIPDVLDCSRKSNVTFRFLCGRPAFPGYLSVSYDYAVCWKFRFSYLQCLLNFSFQYLTYKVLTLPQMLSYRHLSGLLFNVKWYSSHPPFKDTVPLLQCSGVAKLCLAKYTDSSQFENKKISVFIVSQLWTYSFTFF